jgi:hypothetical protein
MSYEESDIINQALQYLIEDNKKLKKFAFVKTSAALAGVKETSDKKFSPVQFWLDKAQSDSQVRVKQHIGYQNSFNSTQYLNWVRTSFLRYIGTFPQLNRYMESASVKKDDVGNEQVGLKPYLQTTIDTPDGDFTKQAAYIDLDNKMSAAFEIILRFKILAATNPQAAGSTGTTGEAGSQPSDLQLESAPTPQTFSLATSNVFENYDEVPAYSYIKQRCEGAISGLNKVGLSHVTGSLARFDYDKWWRNIRTLYMNVPQVIAALQTSIPEAVPEQYALPPALPDLNTEEYKDIPIPPSLNPKGRSSTVPSYPEGYNLFSVDGSDDSSTIRTSAIRPFNVIGPFREQSLKAVNKSGKSSPDNPRVFSLYQLGLKQTAPAASTSSPKNKDDDEEESIETEGSAEKTDETPATSDESSPSSTTTSTDPKEPVDPLNFTDADFDEIYSSIFGRTSQINTDKIVLSARKVNEVIVDVIVKRSDIEPVVNNLLSAIENDLNSRTKQIQDSFQRNVDIAGNVSNIGNKAFTNLAEGFKSQGHTRGKL